MSPELLTIVIIVSVVAVLTAVLLIAYYIIFPRVFVKKLRSGKDKLTYPEHYDSLLAKVDVQQHDYPSHYPNNNYDLYIPNNQQPKGVVIWIHGGFFFAGDKLGVSNVCTAISANGYVVASINYAYAPEYKYPIAILQTDQFVSHFVDSYPQYATLPIIVAGDSAGGNIALQYSLAVSNKDMQKDMNLVPAIDKLTAIVLVCAPIELGQLRTNRKISKLLPSFGRAYFGNGKWYQYDKFKSARLYQYIDNNTPTTFLTDGNSMSFEAQNRMLGDKLRQCNVDVEELYFDIVDGKVMHEYLFDMALDTSKLGIDKLLHFLDRVISK